MIETVRTGIKGRLIPLLESQSNPLTLSGYSAGANQPADQPAPALPETNLCPKWFPELQFVTRFSGELETALTHCIMPAEF